MSMETQEPQQTAGIDDILVPLVGLTVLGATFGAPGLTLGTTASPDGAFHDGLDAAVPA